MSAGRTFEEGDRVVVRFNPVSTAAPDGPLIGTVADGPVHQTGVGPTYGVRFPDRHAVYYYAAHRLRPALEQPEQPQAAG